MKLRITDYAGKSFIIETNESADDFNARIDQAFNTGSYSIRLVGFTRFDVRNIAMIMEVEDKPKPEEPAEEPEQPDEPIEEPSDDPVDEPEPEEPIEG